MATTSSAKKQIRSQAKKQIKNLRHRRNFRATKKEVVAALAESDQEKLDTAVKAFYKAVDKGAKVGAIHPKAAARQKSNLMDSINTAKQ